MVRMINYNLKTNKKLQLMTSPSIKEKCTLLTNYTIPLRLFNTY